MSNTLMWITVLLIYPLLAADTKSATWAFLLGAELACGLYFWLMLVFNLH